MKKLLGLLLIVLMLLATGCGTSTLASADSDSTSLIQSADERTYAEKGGKVNPDFADKIEAESAIQLIYAYSVAAAAYNEGAFTEEDIKDFKNSVTILTSSLELEMPDKYQGNNEEMKSISRDLRLAIGNLIILLAEGRIDVLNYERACSFDDLGLEGDARAIEIAGKKEIIKKPEQYIEHYTQRRVELQEWLDNASQWLTFTD